MPDTAIFDNAALTTQRLIQATPGIQTFASAADNSGLGIGDTNDYFKITASRSSHLVIKLSATEGDAKIALLRSTGDPNDLFAGRTDNPQGLAEAIVTDEPLRAGETYYLRVFADNPTTTINYTFSVETFPETRADVLWRNYIPGDGTIVTWLMNDATFSGDAKLAGPAIDPSWRLEVTGDFDGDGNSDYFWHNTVTGSTAMWLMDATGNGIKSAQGGYPEISGDWYIGGLGDFNGNGTLDIYWRSKSTGVAGVWLMNGTVYAGAVGIDNIVDPAWVVEAVADFDGDNRPDLFYRNISTGANGIWLMNGTSYRENAAAPQVNDVNFRMEGVGDFNGDGNLDLVWRNYATGNNAIWLLDKTNFVAAFGLPTVDPASGYEIAGILTSKPKADLAGNAAPAAFDIGRLNNTANYVDRVSQGDPDDYYKFTVGSSTAKVSASLAGLGVSGNTEITIIPLDPANGPVRVSKIINPDRKEIEEITLNRGDYLVRIQSISPISQDYSFTIGAKEDQPVDLIFTPATPPPIRLFQSNGTTAIAGPVSVRNPFTLNVNYDFTYTGRTLSDFKVGFFISQDGILDATDKRLSVKDALGNLSSTVTVANKLPDTLINVATNVVLPDKNDPYWIQNGTYNIIVFLDPDNELDEKDATGVAKETNNTIATTIQITGARNPDLTITPGFSGTTSTTRGGRVDFSGSVTNIGNARSDSGNAANSTFNVRFYLSRDTIFDGADVPLSPIVEIAALAPGAVSPAFSFTNIALPGATANIWRPIGDPNTTYYIIAYADPDESTTEENPEGRLNNAGFFAITIP
jgi:FG-GAP-like repeat